MDDVVRYMCTLLYVLFVLPYVMRFSRYKTVPDIRSEHGLFNLFDLSSPANITLCGGSSDLMQVSSASVFPDPPRKNDNVTITLLGDLLQPLDKEAYIIANVKRESIHFPQVRFPACDYFVDGCPVEKSSSNVTLKFNVPSFVPSGHYGVVMELYLGSQPGYLDCLRFKPTNDRRVTCVQGSIQL